MKRASVRDALQEEDDKEEKSALKKRKSFEAKDAANCKSARDVENTCAKELGKSVDRHDEENLECRMPQGECCIRRENESLNEHAVDLHEETEMQKSNHWCLEVFRSLGESQMKQKTMNGEKKCN